MRKPVSWALCRRAFAGSVGFCEVAVGDVTRVSVASNKVNSDSRVGLIALVKTDHNASKVIVSEWETICRECLGLRWSMMTKIS